METDRPDSTKAYSLTPAETHLMRGEPDEVSREVIF
jgi:hypothetical protein